MGWVKLDDGFPNHPKVVGLSLEARWAYIESLCYAARYETDGVVPDAVAAKGPVRAELMASGLWENSENSVSIHDYLVYNPSRMERERKRNSSRTLRASREGDGSGTGVVDVGGGGSGEGDAAFDQFWAEYPRKVGKPKARIAFDQALRRVPAARIIDAARRYAEDPNREDAYTAHPTTWLNRDGWNDPSLPARSGRPMRLADQVALLAMQGGDDDAGEGGQAADGTAPRGLSGA